MVTKVGIGQVLVAIGILALLAGSTQSTSGQSEYTQGASDYSAGESEYESGIAEYEEGAADYNEGANYCAQGNTALCHQYETEGETLELDGEEYESAGQEEMGTGTSEMDNGQNEENDGHGLQFLALIFIVAGAYEWNAGKKARSTATELSTSVPQPVGEQSTVGCPAQVPSEGATMFSTRAPTVQSPSGTPSCGTCGATLIEGARFCRRCGASVPL